MHICQMEFLSYKATTGGLRTNFLFLVVALKMFEHNDALCRYLKLHLNQNSPWGRCGLRTTGLRVFSQLD